MADSAGSAADSAAEDSPATLCVDIVSPSAGVPNPLSFPDTPLATTIQQLKEKIRSRLTVADPSTAEMRLIHRGRLLVQPDLTLEAALGADVVQSGDRLALHVVVKEASPRGPAASQAPAPAGPSAAASVRPVPPNDPAMYGLSRPSVPAAAEGAPPIPNPLRETGGLPTPPSQAEIAERLAMALRQSAREAAGYRHIVYRNQRDRAARHLNGIQDQGNQPPVADPGQQAGPTAAPAAPATARGEVREGTLADGTQWRLTVNEVRSTLTTTTTIGGPNPVRYNTTVPLRPHVGAGAPRNPDGSDGGPSRSEAQERGAALAERRRSAAHGAVLRRRHPGGPNAPRESYHERFQFALRNRATGHQDMQQQQQQQQHHPDDPSQEARPQVYVLSSPDGPQAILIDHGDDAYVTPALVRPRNTNPASLLSGIGLGAAQSHTPFTPQPPHQPVPQAQGAQDVFERWREDGQRRHQEVLQRYAQIVEQHRQGQQQGQGQLAGRAVVPLLRAHGHAQGPGALAAAIWPHIWLMIRLSIFLWWFMHPDSSWSRWLSVIGIAVAVLIANTGVLNGFAENAWQPVRQHLDRLLPMGDQPGANNPAQAAPLVPQNDGNRDGAAAQPGEAGAAPAGLQAQGPPDPAEAAARLVAARREANANWLLDQVRRAERAGLLFLASIAPGVAERHIAHLEEQARVERQRREAAEASAAAAAAAAAEAARTEASDGQPQTAEGVEAHADAAGAAETSPFAGPSQIGGAAEGASGVVAARSE